MQDQEINKVIEHLKNELGNLRTNRATPTLVENIKVDAYDTPTPINQVASITAPEPKCLVIQPWDRNLLQAVAKAIEESSLDLNPQVDKDVVRINLPALTEEKRTELVKIMKEKAEDARITVRRLREDTLKKAKQQEKNKELSEDDYFKQEKEVQEKVDQAIKDIDELAENKEQDIMTV